MKNKPKDKQGDTVSEPWCEVTITSLNESVTIRSNVNGETIDYLAKLAWNLMQNIRHDGDK